MDLGLQDKVVVVTGSSRGIGLAEAQLFAAEGARVAINGVDPGRAESAAAAIRAAGGEAQAFAADVTRAAAVDELFARVAAALGPCDVLVNNAGLAGRHLGKPADRITEEDWDAVLDSHLRATWLCTRAALPAMRAAGWGRIVLVSAGSAYLRNHSIYGLAKQALSFLAEELALELGPEVTVNAVAPGQIAESADDIAEFDPSFVERAIAHTPAGRLATRAEVAELVTALCGPSFDMVTGATLPVDGGWRLQRF